MSIKRWSCPGWIYEADGGSWVSFADHEAEVKETIRTWKLTAHNLEVIIGYRDKEIAELRAQVDRLIDFREEKGL